MFNYDAAENNAFEILKRHLANKPVLAIYSPRVEIELHCEASVGILL